MYSQDAEQMSRFFEGLTRTERYVLLLFYADGLTPKEVGLVLEMPEAKVRSMLESLRSDAMRRLGRLPNKPKRKGALARSA